MILSSALYGFTPILVKLSYSGGSNGITASFLRGLFSALFLLPLILVRKQEKRIPLRIVVKALAAGFLGNGATTILLYMSYSYIPVGMTTTIHFIYPAATAVMSMVLFQSRLSRKALLALFLNLAGVGLMSSSDFSFHLQGIILALLSGFTYSFYILYISKSEVRTMPDLHLAFFVNISLVTEALVYGMVTRQLSLRLTPDAWMLSAMVALLASVFAQILFQSGNRIIGAPNAAIISVLEPAVSVLLGSVFLSEVMTGKALIGCACVLIGVVLASLPAKSTT